VELAKVSPRAQSKIKSKCIVKGLTFNECTALLIILMNTKEICDKDFLPP
jgi:hypothetical protein